MFGLQTRLGYQLNEGHGKTRQVVSVRTGHLVWALIDFFWRLNLRRIVSGAIFMRAYFGERLLFPSFPPLQYLQSEETFSSASRCINSITVS